MDPICKLLSPPLPPHKHADAHTHFACRHHLLKLLDIGQGSEPSQLQANKKWSARIAILPAFSTDCQRAPARFQRWQNRLTSWALFLFFLFLKALLQGDQQNEPHP